MKIIDEVAQLPRGSGFKYPWEVWADGAARVATYRIEFQCQPESFRAALHAHAERSGLKVVTSVRGRDVHFQFTKPPPVKRRK
jgi:hypothetical protein